MPSEQETKATLLASGRTEILADSTETKMIDTTDGMHNATTRAFDAGPTATDQRIDLSNLIDDGTVK